MTNEQTTTERKPTTQPLTPPPELLAPTEKRRTIQLGPWRWVILAVAIVIIAGGVFVFTRPVDPLADNRPVAVVQGFVAAIEARDVTKMLAAVEPTVFRREISPEIRSYVEYLQTVSFENSNYTLLDNDGDHAHVRWTATMHYTLNLGDTTKTGDRAVDTTFELNKFEGTWYLHGAVLPKT